MFRLRALKVAGLCPILCFSGLALCCASSGLAQQVDGKSQPTSYWMQKKLEYSQNILGGMATADFDRIVENAEAMRRLSSIEGFIRRQTPGYGRQLQLFEEAAGEIARQANKDNVDGVALAFTQLTISCVNCHKELREAK